LRKVLMNLQIDWLLVVPRNWHRLFPVASHPHYSNLAEVLSELEQLY
jgi:hypothetical protein